MRTLCLLLAVLLSAGCASMEKKQPQQQPVVYQAPVTVQPETTRSAEKVTLSNKQLQTALKNAGFYQGSIDGKIGPKSKKAIVDFQKANGLKPDGIVGKKTTAKLLNYLSE